jgi:hypothetical protein
MTAWLAVRLTGAVAWIRGLAEPVPVRVARIGVAAPLGGVDRHFIAESRRTDDRVGGPLSVAAFGTCAGARRPHHVRVDPADADMTTFILWLLLFVLCWPVALLALLLYPLVWLILLPFRLVGIAVEGVFEFLYALLTLPTRMLRRLA